MDEVEELTLLLMYLTAWNEESLVYNEIVEDTESITIKNCWKGYDFGTLEKLTDKGYLYPSKHKNKIVTLTKDGEALAIQLINKYLKDTKY